MKQRAGIKFIKLWRSRLSEIESVVGLDICGCIIVGGMFVITANIISRFIFNFPFQGLSDIVCLMVVLITYLTLSRVQRDKAHIKMDLLLQKLSGRRWARLILEFIGLLLTIVAAVIIFYLVSTNALYMYQRNVLTEAIFFPQWPIGLAASLGCLMLLIRLGIDLKRQLTGILKGTATEQSKELSDL